MPLHYGHENKARVHNKAFIGQGDKAKLLNKGYWGVDNKAREFYTALEQVTPPADLGTPVLVTTNRNYALTPGTYVFWVMGGGGSGGSGTQCNYSYVCGQRQYEQCEDDETWECSEV